MAMMMIVACPSPFFLYIYSACNNASCIESSCLESILAQFHLTSEVILFRGCQYTSNTIQYLSKH